MVAAMIPEEVAKIRELLGAAYAAGKYDDAAAIFAELVDNDTFVEFLTPPRVPAHRLMRRFVLIHAR